MNKTSDLSLAVNELKNAAQSLVNAAGVLLTIFPEVAVLN